jgi:ferredoxin--NADP+ reductase
VVRRNEIVQDERGLLRARATDAPPEPVEAGLVLRSVGYQAVPLPGVPFDERAFVLPNERGRVAPGVYTVGWIKRGPTGILGTNKRDAEETIASLAEDLRGGVLSDPQATEPIDGLLAERKVGVVTVDGWRAIDGRELEAGRSADRPRVKLASRDELLAAAG